MSPAFGSGASGDHVLLTVPEVAARLRVSASTVYALCDRGELAHVRISNAIRVSSLAVTTFLGG